MARDKINWRSIWDEMEKKTAKNEWLKRYEANSQAAWKEIAANCAKEAYDNNKKSRRGIYVINEFPRALDQVTCIYNNHPYQSFPDWREKETELFRVRIMKVGISELGYATYPSPGTESAGFTYAMILDARDSQDGIIRDAMREAMREASEWQKSRDEWKDYVRDAIGYDKYYKDKDGEDSNELDVDKIESESGDEGVNRKIAVGANNKVGMATQDIQDRAFQGALVIDGQAAEELAHAAAELSEEGYFSPAVLQDERTRGLREIVQRRGQPDFRSKLCAVYNNRCAVTTCDAIAALEAAHIIPYCGPKSNDVSNGLLLRGDIHTLFDLDLLGIDPERFTIFLAPLLQGSSYAELHGKSLVLPTNPAHRPNQQALAQRWQKFTASKK